MFTVMKNDSTAVFLLAFGEKLSTRFLLLTVATVLNTAQAKISSRFLCQHRSVSQCCCNRGKCNPTKENPEPSSSMDTAVER